MSLLLDGTDPATANGDRHQMISSIQHGSDAQVEPSSSLLNELVKAGFAAEELKQAGFKLRSLVSAGFTIGQLKDAGFHPSELKDAEFTLDNFKDAGFTPEELRQAGFVISSMQAAGFNPKQLKRAGFDAAAFKNELRCSVAAAEGRRVHCQRNSRSRDIPLESMNLKLYPDIRQRSKSH